MECIFNKNQLKQVLSDFYNSTGIAITLYDASEKMVATSPVYSGYCSLIRTKKQCVENCNRSNLIHMKEVSESHRISCYTCHSGMMEAIMPIMYEGVLIAYLQIGQFRDAEQRYSSPEKIQYVAKQYGFCADDLLDLYDNTPEISEGKLHSICNIMEILVKSFWVDGLIYYKRSMLSIKIEQYILAHLTEQIYIGDLCDRFFLSKNAIYQLFRNEFNTTINEFILQKRLTMAEGMLQSRQDLNITQISSACGFPDYNYFIRLFKKKIGITPLQFRKNKSRS